MSIPLEDLPDVATVAWTQLRDDLLAILGDDLAAMWAHGGTTVTEGPPRSADLDTHVIVRRPPDERTAEKIEHVHDDIARQHGVELDIWYVLDVNARRPEAPRHAYREGKRDTAWAIHRAHWLAGRYALLYGSEPAQVVRAPTWSELEVDLNRELEHIERHVVEGDTDPYEATYAVLNGSRILHSIDTGDVVLSKRAAGIWAVEHLPDRWHAALRAGGRAYDGQATAEDEELLASDMAPFVAMVRDRLPALARTDAEAHPRWSGY